MKIADFIVCDDIRHEIGNKITLIGIYDQQLSFVSTKPSEEKWPKQLKLGVFARIIIFKGEPVPDAFDLQFIQNGKEFSGIQGNIAVSKAEISFINLALVFNNFTIPEAGQINFKLKLLKDGKMVSEYSPDYALKVTLAPLQHTKNHQMN